MRVGRQGSGAFVKPHFAIPEDPNCCSKQKAARPGTHARLRWLGCTLVVEAHKHI